MFHLTLLALRVESCYIDSSYISIISTLAYIHDYTQQKQIKKYFKKGNKKL